MTIVGASKRSMLTKLKDYCDFDDDGDGDDDDANYEGDGNGDD